MGAFEQLGQLLPSNLVGLESNGEPAAMAVVRRRGKATVLTECVEFERVGQEVKGTA
jgi:hypothetical protein